MSGNPRRSRRDSPRPEAGWGHVADWYDGWVGQRGSLYHRRLAVPLALDLLATRPGEHVLDLGSGQGVLAPYLLAEGARYTGIDISSRLVGIARRRHRPPARFFVGDASRLRDVPALQSGTFDAAVFLLSIQDMAPLASILHSAAWALRSGGRIVIVMTHPAFRQPRHSGWGFDPSRGLTYRRVDAYLTPMAVPLDGAASAGATVSHHRPLSAYVNGLAATGFAVDAMLEVPDMPPRQRPGRAASRGHNPDIPLVLGLRARRTPAESARSR